MLDSGRPFLSAEQIRARVDPDVTKETVRNRLNELRSIDVVAAETYPESITLYYVDHPESNWPLSPEDRRKLAHETPSRRYRWAISFGFTIPRGSERWCSRASS